MRQPQQYPNQYGGDESDDMGQGNLDWLQRQVENSRTHLNNQSAPLQPHDSYSGSHPAAKKKKKKKKRQAPDDPGPYKQQP